MNLAKQEFREKYLNIRKKIINKDVKSHKIFEYILNTSEYNNAKVIGIYKSMKTEVDTNELINYSLKSGKIVLLPRVVNNDMKFYRIFSNNEQLEKSNFGVQEPRDDFDSYYEKNRINLLIVPGVCFDTHGNRLGFGKGYYDRFLYNSNIQTVGIAFNEQIYNGRLPTDKFDVQMNCVINDMNVHKYKTIDERDI